MIPSHYIPPLGSTIRLRCFDYYTSRQLTPWGSLVVDGNEPAQTVGAQHIVHCHPDPRQTALGKEPDTRKFAIPVSEVEPPLGWQKVYEIVQTSLEDLRKPASWLKSGRGILCWFSHDLGAAGRRMFSPADKLERPHWSMYPCDECVRDPERFRFFLQHISHTKPDKKDAARWTYERRDREWWWNELIPYEKLIEDANPVHV